MKPTRFELAILLSAVAIISLQLFVPPRIGMADNGDFDRVLPHSGLAPASVVYEDRYWHYFHLKYPIVSKSTEPNGYITCPKEELACVATSTFLLIRLARWLSIRTGQVSFFDIRILAALYMLLLLVGFWLILAAARSLSTKLRLVLYAALVIVFTDVGYVAYFNSLYSEGTAFVFLTIAIGSSLVLITQQSSSVLFLVSYFLATALFITSKPTYVPLAPAFVIFGIYLSKNLQYVRRYWLAGGLAVLLCWVAVWYYRQMPSTLRAATVYVEIFLDLLPNSNNPRQDLVNLGLNPDLVAFSGTTYGSDCALYTPLYGPELWAKLNVRIVPVFYVSHPVRFYQLCSRCVKYAFSTRVRRSGYYEASSGKLWNTLPFGIWSIVREHTVPRSVFFLGFFFATGIPAVFLIMRSSTPSKPIYVLYLLFVFIAVVQFLMAVLIGGGEPDLEKHLFMFNLAFDSCLVLIILGLCIWVRELIAKGCGGKSASWA